MGVSAKIRDVLLAMDEDAFAVLANRGILRRAKKDLQSTVPVILEENDNILKIQVDDFVVTVPEVPGDARSNSPAEGIDRFVLIALLWLKEQVETTDDSEEESLGKRQPGPEEIGDDALIEWAGKAIFNHARKRITPELSCSFEEKPESVIIFVPLLNITCRWYYSGGLKTIIINGPGRDGREDAVIAILLYQFAKGTRKFSTDELESLKASHGAPKTRTEVLKSLGNVLAELVALGITRVSEATKERLQMLAVSSHGVDLPRLERMIKPLADDISLQLKRNAQASSGQLLGIASRINSLRKALANRLEENQEGNNPDRTPLGELLGVHKSRFLPVGDVNLIGMGARCWRTKSGYQGLSIYFWDCSANRWATWSDSRPLTIHGYDPISVFRAPGPWDGCESPAMASKSLVKLFGAYRNVNGRLSGRSSTKSISVAIDDSYLKLFPEPFENWSKIDVQASRLFGGGLRSRDEQAELVYVRPKSWGKAVFDQNSQTVFREIHDNKGDSLLLSLLYDEMLAPESLSFLENYEPKDGCTVLGLLRFRAGRIGLEPISFRDENGLRSVSLNHVKFNSGTKKKKSKNVSETPEEDEPENEFEEPQEQKTSTKLERLLNETCAELETFAESGFTVPLDSGRLEELCTRIERIGLNLCAEPVREFLDARRKIRLGVDPAETKRAAFALLDAYDYLNRALRTAFVMN